MKAKNRVKTYYSQAMAAEAFDLMYDWRRQSKDFSRVDKRDRFGCDMTHLIKEKHTDTKRFARSFINTVPLKKIRFMSRIEV